jgi:hypothetical protein
MEHIKLINLSVSHKSCVKALCFLLQKCKDPEASLVDTFARTEPPDTQVSEDVVKYPALPIFTGHKISIFSLYILKTSFDSCVRLLLPCLVTCDVVLSGESVPTFDMILLPPSSTLLMKSARL